MSHSIMLSEQAMLARLTRAEQGLEAPIMAADQALQAGEASYASLSQMVQAQVNSVNQDQVQASQLIRQVELGQSDDLVGAIVAGQKADLSFTAMVQIRNRLVKALDDIMNMPL